MKTKEPFKLRRVKRRVMHPVELAMTRFLCFMVNTLSPGLSVRLGGAVGGLMFSPFRVRRSVCMKNLEIAFPDMPMEERLAVGRRSYANIGRTMTEILMMERIDGPYIDAHVELHGREHVDAVVAAGKGGLAVTGHYGSWELLAAAYSSKGYPLDLLIGHQKNKKVDELFNDLRKRQGLGLIPLNRALKGVLRAVKKNRLVALLGDQDARRGAGIDVEFFGRPTSTYPGIALFSVKSGAPILCPFIVRRGTGLDHDIFLEPPLAFTPQGDRNEDVKNLTQLHVLKLEEWIRKHPDHWFWGHKRWKSKGLY